MRTRLGCAAGLPGALLVTHPTTLLVFLQTCLDQAAEPAQCPFTAAEMRGVWTWPWGRYWGAGTGRICC